jgi:hypothetical protein
VRAVHVSILVMEQRLFSSPMLGIGTLQVAVDVPRPNKWYRPSDKDTLLICLAALLYEMPSRGMGTERSHTASCRYKVSPSRRRPCWHTGHTAPGSLPATSGVLRSITSARGQDWLACPKRVWHGASFSWALGSSRNCNGASHYGSPAARSRGLLPITSRQVCPVAPAMRLACCR